jgi:hypothetical protein
MVDIKDKKASSVKKRKPAANADVAKATKDAAQSAKKAAKKTATKKSSKKTASSARSEALHAQHADELYQSIALLAYFKAEARNFLPGFEVDDWVAAEIEILQAGETQPADD